MKFIWSNSVHSNAKNSENSHHPYVIPGYDLYNAGFSICDKINRYVLYSFNSVYHFFPIYSLSGNFECNIDHWGKGAFLIDVDLSQNLLEEVIWRDILTSSSLVCYKILFKSITIVLLLLVRITPLLHQQEQTRSFPLSAYFLQRSCLPQHFIDLEPNFHFLFLPFSL